MHISYNKLWKLLIDRGMSSADLRRATGIAPNTFTKLRRNEEVSLSVLARICQVLRVDIGDVMTFVEIQDSWGMADRKTFETEGESTL